jgi:hypothetical protein
MPRKLKTYLTAQGFYDLATAAPSMKAAPEAWEASSNLFHQGFAKEADDDDVIAATMEDEARIAVRKIPANHSNLTAGRWAQGLPHRPDSQYHGRTSERFMSRHT